MVWEKRRLDEEKALDKRITLNISLNLEEQRLLDKLIEAYGIKDKGKVLKKAAFLVAQTPFLMDGIKAGKESNRRKDRSNF